VTSDLQEKLRDKEARKARELLVLAGKMTNYEALKFVIDKIKANNGNGNAESK